VDAASSSLTNLLSAVNYARNISTVSVVSMSWGSGEFYGETSYDNYFTTPAGHIGITFVAASGDEGASGGPEWPAVSPDVLSVGGTTLTLTSTGAIASESAWSDSSGGSSQLETLSVQQSATGLSTRSAPDVAFDANPSTGVAVYDSVAYDGYVGWQEVGGTSVGAPSWAGIIAIADSARVSANSATLTTSQVLTDVYTIYENSTAYANDFHDITTGSSLLGYSFGGFGGFGGFRPPTAVYVTATTGYDTLTGLGSPNGAGLLGALESSSATSSTAASTKAPTTAKTTATAVKNALVEDVYVVGTLLAFQNVHSATIAPAPTATAIEVPQVETTTAAVAMTEASSAGATLSPAAGRAEIFQDDVATEESFVGFDSAAALTTVPILNLFE
jgi:subtilase family serine protease